MPAASRGDAQVTSRCSPGRMAAGRAPTYQPPVARRTSFRSWAIGALAMAVLGGHRATPNRRICIAMNRPAEVWDRELRVIRDVPKQQAICDAVLENHYRVARGCLVVDMRDR